MAASRTMVRALFCAAAGIVALTLQPACAADTDAAPVDSTYRVQPGDTLQVTVWKEQDLQAEVLVRPDGGMNFPLAGDIVAGGRTVDDIRMTILSRLSKYIPDPVVTVLVKKTDGSRIFVVGRVNHPGDFPLIRPMDVLQALSVAGGATPFADVNDIRVIRRVHDSQLDSQQVFRFRYDDVRRGKALSQNIVLQSGDTVVVP